MRIISKFHDYYDCIQGYGQDDDLIYHRKNTVIDRRRKYSERFNYFDSDRSLLYRQGVVGFCGERRLFLDFSIIDGPIHCTCYTPEDVHRFVEGRLKKRDFRDYNAPDKHRCWRFGWSSVLSRDSVEDLFKRWSLEKKTKASPIFEKYRSPIYITYDDETIINACLKDIEFYRIFEPYMAFQEIAMFLSNMALPEPSTITISDEHLAASKGYDKFSFRKPPSKRR